MDTILYGAAYYQEYMPDQRLDKDIELMKKAGLSVVRLGESTWSSFEPQDGQFEFAWMDRILDKFNAAGIKVIFGTPTHSVPVLAVSQTSRDSGYLSRRTEGAIRLAAEHGYLASGVPVLLGADDP